MFSFLGLLPKIFSVASVLSLAYKAVKKQEFMYGSVKGNQSKHDTVTSELKQALKSLGIGGVDNDDLRTLIKFAVFLMKAGKKICRL